MFSVCLQRNDISQKEGRGKLLNPTNRPSGLRRFHSTSHEISNTLQSVGRHSNAQTHASACANPHAYSAGINPKFGWQPPTGSCRSSWISKHIWKGFSGEELTAPDRKELRHYLQNRTAHAHSLKTLVRRQKIPPLNRHIVHLVHIWLQVK